MSAIFVGQLLLYELRKNRGKKFERKKVWLSGDSNFFFRSNFSPFSLDSFVALKFALILEPLDWFHHVINLSLSLLKRQKPTEFYNSVCIIPGIVGEPQISSKMFHVLKHTFETILKLPEIPSKLLWSTLGTIMKYS